MSTITSNKQENISLLDINVDYINKKIDDNLIEHYIKIKQEINYIFPILTEKIEILFYLTQKMEIILNPIYFQIMDVIILLKKEKK